MLLYRKSSGHIERTIFIDNSVSVFVWRVWFKRKYLNLRKIMFDQTLRYGEDRIFLLENLVNNPKIKVCDDVFGYVHTIEKGRGNLTELKTLRKYNEWLFKQQIAMDKAEQHGVRSTPN